MARVRINISLDPETEAKLREFADKYHTTASQFITDRIWEFDRKEQEKAADKDKE